MSAPRPATPHQHDLKTLRAAICWGGRVGPAAFRKLMLRFETEAAILAATPIELAHSGAGLTADQIKALTRAAAHTAEYAEAITALQADAIHVITSTEDAYPRRFSTLRNPPPILCVRGITPADDAPSVAIVGTREATRADLAKAHDIAAEFTAAGFTIVSGLARGVDAAAHMSTLQSGGHTVAILGSGIHNIYPPEHDILADEIAGTGAVISEIAPYAPPARGTLLARNRLISALSITTIVIATRISGGTMSTAKAAREQNRILAAVQWNDESPSHQGNRALINDGAVPLSSSADLARLREMIAHASQNDASGQMHPTDQTSLFD